MPSRFRPLALTLCAAACALVLGACNEPQVARDALSLEFTPRAAVTADFDGNGQPDILVGHDAGEYLGVTLFAQDRYGFFSKREPAAPVGGSDLLAVVDLDGDPAPDAVAGWRGSPYLTTMRNNGDGDFTTDIQNLGSVSINALAGGVAPDGTQIVAVAHTVGGGEKVAVYRAVSGALQRIDPSSEPSGGKARTLALYDVNADGRIDLLVGTEDGRIEIHYGQSPTQGRFSASPDTTLTAPGRSSAVTTIAVGDAVSPPEDADWQLDGHPDVLAAFADSALTYGWRGQGGGSFAAAVNPGGPRDYPGGPLSDGFPDRRLIALSVAADGRWGGVLETSVNTVAFMIDSGGYGFARLGQCDPVAGTVIASDSATAPIGAVVLCEDAGGKKVLVGFPGRTRLQINVPAEVDLGTVEVGQEGGEQTFQLKALDWSPYAEEEPPPPNGPWWAPWPGSPTGWIEYQGTVPTGPDADEFRGRLVDPSYGACGWWDEGNFPKYDCTIGIKFKPTSHGDKEAVVELRSNAYRQAGAPFPSFKVKGRALGARADAPATVDLGDVRLGKGGSAEVRVTNGGNKALRVDELRLSAGAAEAGWEVDEPDCDAVAPGSDCVVEVRFKPEALGAGSATLTVGSDAYNDPDPITVTARAVASGVTAAPVDFGPVVVGGTGIADVAVTNTGDAPLTVEDVQVEGPDAGRFAVVGSTCDGVEVDPGEPCTVKVSVTPISRGDLAASLRLVSDAPSSPNVVALSARGVQGVLQAPSLIALDPLRVGFHADRTVELVNGGDHDLKLGRLAVESGAVTLHADGCSHRILRPAERCVVTLRFAPTRIGEVDARLRVPNDGEGGERVIPVRGKALPPEERPIAAGKPDGSGRPATLPAPTIRPTTATGGGKAPARVETGSTARVRITLRNPLATAVRNARLEVRLPAERRWVHLHRRAHVDGDPATRKLTVPLGTLKVRASKTVTVQLHAGARARRGRVPLQVRLLGSGARSKASTMTVEIR